MIGELQPKFDYRPQWKHADPADPASPWVPDIDEATGLQRVKRIAVETIHELFWPGDANVSAITAKAWFTLSKGWNDTLNPVSGNLWFAGTNTDRTPAFYTSTAGAPGAAFTLMQDRELTVELPVNTKKISIRLDAHDHAIGWAIEAKAL